MEKEKYYINVETQEISEEPIPDGSQFEVIATTNEFDKIKNMFNELSQISGDALKYLATPFDESSVDDKRDDYQDELMSLYGLIYDSGTLETRMNMVKSGILKKLK